MLATFGILLLLVASFGAGFWFARAGLGARRARALVTTPPPRPEATARFELVYARGTPEWSVEMRRFGHRLADAGVSAVVFAHGTFTGTDPLSAYGVVERALPAVGRDVARTLRKKTRIYVDRVLGDMGNFGPTYVRLFEEATDRSIPCTTFVWSSENHHVGRLEGALGLVRVLAAHAELAGGEAARPKRILLYGHSHAGQVFALVSQLLARSVATEAILDVARARGLDVGALDVDLDRLARVGIDFVTFGAPARYAWAKLDHVRVLHVTTKRDWIQRIGQQPSDFPPLAAEDRRVNASLEKAPWTVAAEEHGERIFVDYAVSGIGDLVTSGFGHAHYTRLDAMLFHARLIADRLYPEPALPASERPSWLRAS